MFNLMPVLALAFSQAVDPRPGAKQVDLAICLDTSNSMDGLIDSAKVKLWRVVNDLARIDPAPSLRVALFSYGNNANDPSKGWVRQEIGLTHDIDEVYRKLFELRTNGGNEFVARVCRDALVDLKWSEQKGSLKIVFVCGNEPADQDKEVGLPSVVNLAKKKDVVVNTIYCQYGRPDVESGWKLFSGMCGGKHAVIDQNKKRPVIDTPFDKDIRDLSGRINDTYVPFGAAGRAGKENQAKQDNNALQAAPGAALDRGGFKASGLYFNEWDLIDKLKANPKLDLRSLKAEDLPSEMREMSAEQREAHVRKKMAERVEIQGKMSDLTARRAKFIEEAEKKLPADAGEKSFDEAVRAMLREQAAAKEMRIP